MSIFTGKSSNARSAGNRSGKTPAYTKRRTGSSENLSRTTLPTGGSPEQVSDLQRNLGNRASGRLWSGGIWLSRGGAKNERVKKSAPVRESAATGRDPAPGDVAPRLQMSRFSFNPLVMTSRKPAEEKIQQSGLESSIQTAGAGQPLSVRERSYFEPRFGTAFAHVNIHNNKRSHSIARALHARAFTVGQNIYFGANSYSPETLQGKRLMAHELTHTLQQNRTQAFSFSGHPAASVIQRRTISVKGIKYYKTGTPEFAAIKESIADTLLEMYEYNKNRKFVKNLFQNSTKIRRKNIRSNVNQMKKKTVD